MNYQTITNEVMNWLFSDLNHSIYVVLGLAVLGAVIGIYRSFKYCKNTSHCGRRVL